MDKTKIQLFLDAVQVKLFSEIQQRLDDGVKVNYEKFKGLVAKI